MIETMGQVEPDYICLTLSASMKSKDMIEIITNLKIFILMVSYLRNLMKQQVVVNC